MKQISSAIDTIDWSTSGAVTGGRPDLGSSARLPCWAKWSTQCWIVLAVQWVNSATWGIENPRLWRATIEDRWINDRGEPRECSWSKKEMKEARSNRIEVVGSDEDEELLQSQQVECPENFFNNFHFRQLEQIFWEPYKHNTRLYASPTAPTVSKETTSTTYCIDRSPSTDIDRRTDHCRSWHDRKMQDQALEPNERMTFILSSMQSLSIIDSSDTRACSSSHFLQAMMNRSVLLLEIMNGKYFEVQDFLLQQFARKSLSCSKSWHWPINLKLGVCTSHNILNSLPP